LIFKVIKNKWDIPNKPYFVEDLKLRHFERMVPLLSWRSVGCGTIAELSFGITSASSSNFFRIRAPFGITFASKPRSFRIG